MEHMSEWDAEMEQLMQETAELCKAKVANLPKGQKGHAYRDCVLKMLSEKL